MKTRIRQKFLQSPTLENSSSLLKKQKGKGEEVGRGKPRRRPKGGERKRGRHLGSQDRTVLDDSAGCIKQFLKNPCKLEINYKELLKQKMEDDAEQRRNEAQTRNGETELSN